MNTPTPEQIASAVAATKEMVAAADIPYPFRNMIPSDDVIAEKVTIILTAGLNPPANQS